MLTEKEFVLIRKQTEVRTSQMAAARREAAELADPNASRCYKKSWYVKYIRSMVKNARKANAKIVAAKVAGRARPVSIVLATIMPLMEGFATAAADRTTKFIADVRAKVAAQGLDAAFPDMESPKYNAPNYRAAMAKYEEVTGRRSFAARVSGLVERCDAEEFATREIEEAVFFARASFLSYAWKLDSKVGAITAATLTTVYGVWGESFLDVTKPDGSVIRWKTQTITNYSVYGRPYFQWPTRIVKG